MSNFRQQRMDEPGYLYEIACEIYYLHQKMNKILSSTTKLAILTEALDKIGHRNEPESFTGDKMLGYLQCCEDVIKDANEALAKINKQKEGNENE